MDIISIVIILNVVLILSRINSIHNLEKDNKNV